MKTTCKRCLYWERMEETVRFGVCHRNAPAPAPRPAGEPVPSVWPVTFCDDWCGDAERRAAGRRTGSDRAIEEMEEMAE